ncbi:hypothetical protein A2311_05450 [candidate division WOR-1 bacterium RIFOXYB2_FULL_48_7]|uniref:Ribosomal RNA small subunit methyltransferase A n=1 Tax=candidate division WOR-1 bacterium RIFOXYB2_FULL_48_7 TaxID=1802583 RepID=A0A1F4TJS8_UNCSA|nr:MAG: hypothetical protein A2311_05450 [candidate division WOR-1 bacterium RIFOXYB2_FULL_48_7]
MNRTLAQITRELLATYNRFPRKSLGQHFLIDPLVVQRIIKAAELTPADTVIEIGSGLGVVTAEIAAQAGQLTAIEIDKELVQISQEILSPYPNVSVVQGDILKTVIGNLVTGNRPYKVIGNLPYYITSPIIEKILTGEHKPTLAVLMAQKEVAERMAAKPGSKKYGSFSIFTQFYADVELVSLVSKSSFLPWPEVSSAIIKLTPYQSPRYQVNNEKLFFDLVHRAFQQRRKTLRNSLKEFALTNPPIDLSRRPETLAIEEFVQLANML